MAERDFDEFYASSHGRLVVQVLGVTGNLADAEDAVQESFARGIREVLSRARSGGGDGAARGASAPPPW